ncbi:MAG: hypothetical protein ACE5ED_03575 [Rhodothalassiaceae bacterium]
MQAVRIFLSVQAIILLHVGPGIRSAQAAGLAEAYRAYQAAVKAGAPPGVLYRFTFEMDD